MVKNQYRHFYYVLQEEKATGTLSFRIEGRRLRLWREGVTSMNEIYFSYFKRDDFSDYLYGVLGRLLTYATAFENDLKKLCLLLNFKYSHVELSDAVIMKIHHCLRSMWLYLRAFLFFAARQSQFIKFIWWLFNQTNYIYIWNE